MKITLIFDAEKNLSELYFDRRRCTNQGLRNAMLEKPLEKWLKPFNNRYTVWKGFLVELSDVLNTRNFVFQIFATPDVYEQFQSLTKKIIPMNFNVAFEFEEKINSEEQILDSAFIAKIISMLKNDKYLLRRLRLIQKSVDKINCQVIYENYRESYFLRQINSPIQINSLEISMPLILISDKKFSENPYEICQQHQIKPTDTMIIFVVNGREEDKLQVLQLKQNFKDIPIFLLTGSSEADGLELAQMTRLYNSYKKKAFRRFILDYPDDVWIEPRTVKNLIATL